MFREMCWLVTWQMCSYQGGLWSGLPLYCINSLSWRGIVMCFLCVWMVGWGNVCTHKTGRYLCLGRCAGGWRDGCLAAGRDTAVTGHWDVRRGVHQTHQPQHHHPHQEVPDLLHSRWRPDPGGDQSAPGRARDGQRQQAAGAVHTGQCGGRRGGGGGRG